MRYLERLNPAGGIADFWDYVRQPQPYRWAILLASAVLTLTILSLIIWDRNYIAPPAPKVTYISTFEEGRSDAEILASNIENQRIQEERRAAREASEERRRDIYRDLGRASGIDVDAIDERVARERAAAEAEERKRQEELLRNVRTAEEALADSTE